MLESHMRLNRCWTLNPVWIVADASPMSKSKRCERANNSQQKGFVIK